VMRKVTRHTIPWLFGLGIACYLDRTNLAFAAVQLSRDLELSCTVYGLGAALFFIGYSFQIPSTIACRRFGAPLWLSIIVGVWGLVAMAFAATTGKVMFLVLRVALGLAECGTFPGIWHHLSQFYTPQELGSAYATVVTSTALAQVVGAPMAAAILSLDGVGGLRGWQWLFISEGALTIAFAALLKANLAKSPSEATYLTPSERAWLQRRQDMQPSAGGAENVTLQFNAAARKNFRCSLHTHIHTISC
jgi:MFS transporter, ACS family, tartrate transporter